MKITAAKGGRLLLAVFIMVAVATLALSTHYYRSLVLEPVAVLRGANLTLRSILNMPAADSKDMEQFKALIKQDHEPIDPMKSHANKQNVRASLDGRSSHSQKLTMKNQEAANKTRLDTLSKDIERLEASKEGLIKSQNTLGSLNRNYEEAAQHSNIAESRRSAINGELIDSDEIASNDEVKGLLSGRAQRPEHPNQEVPQSVLDNVHKSTGISPEEINSLMNQ